MHFYYSDLRLINFKLWFWILNKFRTININVTEYTHDILTLLCSWKICSYVRARTRYQFYINTYINVHEACVWDKYLIFVYYFEIISNAQQPLNKYRSSSVLQQYYYIPLPMKSGFANIANYRILLVLTKLLKFNCAYLCIIFKLYNVMWGRNYRIMFSLCKTRLKGYSYVEH